MLGGLRIGYSNRFERTPQVFVRGFWVCEKIIQC
jgi:hypothetical protein